MRSTLKPWVVALGLALVAEIAPAAGFGRINVNSALGQPLAAEIDLLNVSPEDLVGMQVKLASPESFREANVELSPALNGVRFSIEKRPNGQPYIRVSSTQPISEPALNLLVEVTWPSGRLLRDYPVLLNPAGYTQERLASENAPRLPPSPPEVPVRPAAEKPAVAAPPTQVAAAAPPPPAPTPRAKPAPAKAESAKPEAPKPETAKPDAAKAEAAPAAVPAGKGSAPAAPGDGYTVKPGDTLRGLAAGNRPSSASLEQTMLAMFEANRAAFINDSIHRIRAGKRIHLPNADEAAAVAPDEASRRVNLLATDFEAYRKRLADSAAAKPSTAAAEKGPVTGKLTANTEDAARPPKPGGSDVLQVSRGAAAKAAETGQAQRKTAADEKANRLEEEAIARENQLREAKERVAMLETNLQQMRKLVNDKAPAADKSADAKTAVEPTPAASLKPPVTVPEELKPAAPAVNEAAKPAAPAKPVVKPAPTETNFTDELVNQLSDNPLALGGGVLGAILVGWLGINSLRRRRERTQELFAPTTSTPEPMTVDAVTVDKASAVVDSSQPAYASGDFGRVVPDHQVDEVDPVAEADVYIAYGRDVQAEEILKEAMAKDPDRTEILMKLLEIYAQRRSVAEYAQHAVQLRERVGIGHPLWSAAMAMGYEIDPDNPLYQGAGDVFVPVASPVPPAAAREALDLDLSEPGLAGPAAEFLHPGEPLDEVLPDLDLLPTLEPGRGITEIGMPDIGTRHAGEQDRLAAASAEASPEAQHLAHNEETLHAAEPHAEEDAEDEAAATLRALSAISAESLRGTEATATSWPSLPDVPVYGAVAAGGLSLAASNERSNVAAEAADPFTLDFDLGESGKAGNASMAHGNAALDLGKIDLDMAAEPVPSSPPVLTLVPSVSAAPVAAVPGEAHPEVHSFADINLDLAAPAGAADHHPDALQDQDPGEQSSQWHNVATKLDLARAYLEIGDKDGAREILREVSVEGDEAQRQEAERLAVQI